MKRILTLILVAAIFLPGCIKPHVDDQNNCEKIHSATITSNSPVTFGQTIKFGTQEVGGYRIYDWSGPNHYDGQEPSDSFTYAEFKHEGWYHLHLYSLDGDCEKFDSVYVDVKLKQGNPSCTITTNTTEYNNQGTDNYTSVTKTIDAGLSLKVLKGSGPTSDITIFFHPYWRTAEPEDGIYTTSDTQLFTQSDGNYNKVFITTTKSSIYWANNPGQTVYISHVNGKLQVRFCGLSLIGSNGGSTFTTLGSGNVVQL